MKFNPTGSRILVDLLEEETTASGLYISKSARSRKAKVVAISTTWNPKDQDAVVNVGQIVLLDSLGGVEIDFDGKKMLLVRNDEILGYFKEEN